MIVLVPYADGRLHPRVLPSLRDQGYDVMTWRVENVVGSPNSYPKILSTMLLGLEDVCVVEHDVESRPGFLADLEACPEPWCFYAYDLSLPWDQAVEMAVATAGQEVGSRFAPLGHTRFRAGFCEQIRGLLESDVFAATWVARDSMLVGALAERGCTPHRHPGKAIHHHQYPTSD